MLASLNNSHIIFGAIHFESSFLNVSMVDCKGIVFLEKLVERRGCHYELNVAPFLEIYLFCCSAFDCGTFKLRGNMQTEKKKRHSL